MSTEPSSSPRPARDDGALDDALDAAVAGYVDRLNRGERILEEEVLLDHPGAGHEVFERLQTFLRVGGGSRGAAPAARARWG